MVMTDPIADMLTRIRNAITAGHKNVHVPLAKIKQEIVGILKELGYIEDFEILPKLGHGAINIKLKYVDDDDPVIKGIQRVSRPGLRVYVGCDEIPRVLNGMGIAIISTSKGIMTDSQGRKSRIGGEVLCIVW